MPASISASRTWSNWFSRMIATISFILLAWIDHAITSFTMIDIIKAFHFTFRAGAYTHDFIQNKQDHKCYHGGIGCCDRYSNCLYTELAHCIPATSQGGCI